MAEVHLAPPATGVAAGPFTLTQGYAAAVPELSVARRAASFPEPGPVVIDEPLAAELGVDPAALRTPEGTRLLVGDVPAEVPTVAQAYAGHQFGGYSPLLGDGRALLLGEIVDTAGRRKDLHLKGSGRTPFARGGDGKAVLGPMLREHLMGVAMHALGIPTSRALAVCTTGERVPRDGVRQPGVVLARVAASHLRVGTFQLAAQLTAHPETPSDATLLERLTAYALQRHFPDAADPADTTPGLTLLRQVSRVQAELIAQWMQVGFIHGVMNTDNMTISGETIDYGPCAFLDGYDPATVFSSIDTGGRYAYGNQPAIAQWNLARLAETLLPLIADDREAAVEAATEIVVGFAGSYQEALVAGFSRKLGLPAPDEDLVTDGLALLQRHRVDHTGFFRALSAGTAADLFPDPAVLAPWATRREALLVGEPGEVAAAMDRINPAYIARNHVVEEALAAAAAGDLAPYERLVDALREPYAARPGLDDLSRPAPADAGPHVTFCGT